MSGSHLLDTVHSVEELRGWEQSGTWLAVIGHPIKHSISPPMHNAALEELSRKEPSFSNWKYVRFEVHPKELNVAIELFREAGFCGINLTVPHKIEVLPLIELMDPEAERMGAVNTIHFKNGKIYGYNSDGYGLENALRDAFGSGLQGREVCILGAGGASRAAVAQCVTSGAAKISIANRTAEKAEQLIARLNELGVNERIEVIPLDRVSSTITPGTLIINATSLGLRPDDPLPVDVSSLPEDCLLYDMIYNPWETGFLQAGGQRGFPVANGLGMLVHQGVRSLEIWTERKINAQTMKSAALKSMGRECDII